MITCSGVLLPGEGSAVSNSVSCFNSCHCSQTSLGSKCLPILFIPGTSLKSVSLIFWAVYLHVSLVFHTQNVKFVLDRAFGLGVRLPNELTVPSILSTNVLPLFDKTADLCTPASRIYRNACIIRA